MPEYQTTTTGLYIGKSLASLEDGVLSKLGEPSQTFNRYTQAEIQAHLNAGLREFCYKTRLLRGMAIVVLKQNVVEYKLPTNFLDFINPRWPARFRAADGSGYTRLERTSEQRLDNSSGTWRDKTGKPEAVYMGGVYGNTRLLGVYPKPDADGSAYDVSADTGVVVSATNYALGGNITGNHKAGFANSAFLVDAEGRDLAALGAVVGMIVHNLTDGSKGAITAIGNQDATNDKISVTLAGGSENDWDESDSFIIYAGEYGVITSWEDATEQYIFNTEYGTLASITIPNGNIWFTYVRDARKLELAAQYPEIPALFHEDLEWYAASVLLGTEHDGRIDPNRAAAYAAIWNAAISKGKEMASDHVAFPEAIEFDPDYIGDL